MRRKLIKQGGHSLTIYLPKGWVTEHSLQAGDEVEVERAQEKLVIATTPSTERKKIALAIPGRKESNIRTVLVNAYRQGYDQMVVRYDGDAQDIRDVVRQHLLGFDLIQQQDREFLIESVAEPRTENFEKLIERQFFILLEVIRGIGKRSIREDVLRMQEYDNFLKRCLTKRILSSDAAGALWQLLSTLIYAAKQIAHLEEFLECKSKTPDDDATAALATVEQMLRLLQKGYLSRKLEPLARLHEMNAQFESTTAIPLLNGTDPVIAYFIASAGRFIYVANSPVTSILYSEGLSV